MTPVKPKRAYNRKITAKASSKTVNKGGTIESLPVTNDPIVEFYDNFLDHLKVDHKRDNPRHLHIKQKLGSIISYKNTVLDLGCGTGITSVFMARLGAVVTAVDISPKLIEFAKEHSAHKNITYMIADNCDIILGKKFDVIVMADVLEHIPPDKVISFLSTVEAHSHDHTTVYLNIPDARFQVVMKQELSGMQQIVDEVIPLEDILGNFKHIGFEAVNIEMYGLDTRYQYTDSYS